MTPIQSYLLILELNYSTLSAFKLWHIQVYALMEYTLAKLTANATQIWGMLIRLPCGPRDVDFLLRELLANDLTS